MVIYYNKQNIGHQCIAIYYVIGCTSIEYRRV